MAKPTKLEYLHSTYASYSYIYHFAKNFSGDDLHDDPKTIFALGYLLEHFSWGLSNLIKEGFREDNSEMDDLFWLMLAAAGEGGGGFALDDIPDVIFGDLNLVKFFPTFQKIYRRELKKLNYEEDNKDDQKNDLPWDTLYKYPIHTRHSIWTVKKR